jgi:hypothetical protein
MRRLGTIAVIGAAAALAVGARGGHELPVYPSYYPHEIEITALPPAQAAVQLRDGKVQAYLGGELDIPDAAADRIRTIESLGSFVVARINPDRAALRNEAAACAALKSIVNELAGRDRIIVHPYPVTPFHGDYLYHADLAAMAKARFADTETPVPELKVRTTSSAIAQALPGWSADDADWDVEVGEVDAGALLASATLAMDGRLGPPWARHGWFHAERLLADAVEDPPRRARAQGDKSRLESGDFSGLAERINLERDLVTALTGGCRKLVAGYTVKREPINVEYSSGIENVGYDAIAGLRSPMFIRTVKLKDFPWNGWLGIATSGAPSSAWNPIGGMTDPFGRLVGFAVGDPALLPAPYDAGWMLNRISDLPTTSPR